jgi:hypothetical protein
MAAPYEAGRALAPSIVGIRSTWTCAACGGKAVVCQFIRVGSPNVEFDLPPRWSAVDKATYCGAHLPDAAFEDRVS